MKPKFSVIALAIVAAFISWHGASAQYGQDTTNTRRYQSDTTMRRTQTDTTNGLYRNQSRDTTMKRNRYQRDTLRTWTPSNNNTQPDTSSGVH